jgi:hypothetical protein
MSRRAKRALGAVAGAVTLLLLSVTIWIKVNSRDIPVPDTSDLLPARSEVPDEENAYTYLAKAFELLKWPKDETKIDSIFIGETWDDAFVADLVSSNAEALASMKRGLACRVFQVPETSTPGMEAPLLQWTTVSRLMTLRAMYEHQTGQVQRAWDDSIDLLSFGSLIVVQPGSLMDYPVGMAIIERGLGQAWPHTLCGATECCLYAAGTVGSMDGWPGGAGTGPALTRSRWIGPAVELHDPHG